MRQPLTYSAPSEEVLSRLTPLDESTGNGKFVGSGQHYSLIEGDISADGVHKWPFRPGFPLDYLNLTCCARNVRMNRHDYCELVYMRSGSAKFEVQDRSYEIHRGDLIVVGPSLYHRVYLQPGMRARLSLIFFQPELLNGSSTAESAEYLMPFCQQTADFPVVIPAASGLPPQVFEFMKRIGDEMPGCETRSQLTAKTYLKTILVMLLKHYAELLETHEAFHRREHDISRLQPVFGLLEKNFSRQVSTGEAARCCAMSSSHFMCFFKRVTGQSFIAYVNRFRVAKAQELLRTTKRGISDISQETGFCDQSHFGITFRRMVGMTPREYRQQFSGKNAAFIPENHDQNLVH